MSKMQEVSDWMRKYLFWILTGFVVIFAFLAWYFYTNRFQDEYKSNTAKIEEHKKTGESVVATRTSYDFHPNENTNKDLENITKSNRGNLAESWKKLSEIYQKEIYVWPKISDSFNKWIVDHPALTDDIPHNFRLDYRNFVKKELERIVKAADIEWPGDVVPGGQATGRRNFEESPVGTEVKPDKIKWMNIENIYKRYDWGVVVPSVTSVRLAQEDLWVLEALTKMIKNVNGNRAPFERPIKMIEDLEIEGFAIANEPVIRGEGANRIKKPDMPTTPEGTSPMGPGTGEVAAVVATGAMPTPRPPRFDSAGAVSSVGGGGFEEGLLPGRGRFGPAPAPAAASTDPAAAASASPDDQFYEWRYVDSNGKPLTKAELSAPPYNNGPFLMMPFRMRVHLVQQYMSKFLEEIQNSKLRLEVNQVRINTEFKDRLGPVYTPNTGGGIGGGAAANNGGDSKIPLDEIVVEVQGFVYIIQPYDTKKLYPEGAPAEEQAAATPAAITPVSNP